MSYKAAHKFAELLVQNGSESLQSGGASKVSSRKSNSLDVSEPSSSDNLSKSSEFAAFSVGVLVWVVMMLLLAWIVQSCYNYIMPRLVLSYGGQDKLQKFQELKYVDALVLLLLTKCLF